MTFVSGGGNAFVVDGSVVRFNGGSWISGNIAMDGGTEMYNLGVFNITSGDGMSRSPTDSSLFVNTASGTVDFNSTGTTWFSVPFTTYGTVNVLGQSVRFIQNFNQYGGTVDLGGGSLDLAAGGGVLQNAYYNLYGGELLANGTISNARALWVDGGTLVLDTPFTLIGDLRTTLAGTIQINPSSGVANVTGTVTLFGALTVESGTFAPPQGTKWTFLTSTQPIADWSSDPAGWQVNKLTTPAGFVKSLELEKL